MAETDPDVHEQLVAWGFVQSAHDPGRYLRGSDQRHVLLFPEGNRFATWTPGEPTRTLWLEHLEVLSPTPLVAELAPAPMQRVQPDELEDVELALIDLGRVLDEELSKDHEEALERTLRALGLADAEEGDHGE